MSDARPITNITDFVCGSCWSTFSRADPGVVQGDVVVCPHCSTPMAAGGGGDELADAVRRAPRAAELDSAEFKTANFRDTTDFASAPPAGAPRQGTAWLPPDERDEARATARTPIALGPGRLAADSDDYDAGFGQAGVVVGEPDDGFAVAENTLNGSQDTAALLEAVRQTSPIPKAFVLGDELSVATDEPTPIDAAAMQDPAFAEPLAVIARDPTGTEAAKSDAEADADLIDEMAALEQKLPETSLAHRDWKLKAMGITYNFHGLDPLFSWAANKSGQPMSLSHDGENWKDFHTFYTAIREGVPVKRAFESAPDPEHAPPPPATPRVTRTINQVRPELPDLEGLRPPPDATPGDLSSLRMPSPGAPVANRGQAAPAAAPAPTTRPSAPATGANAAVKGSHSPSGNAIRAAATAASRQPAALGPSTSPSKRMPVADVKPAAKLSAGTAVGVALVVLLVAAAALHVTGVVRIPGLP